MISGRRHVPTLVNANRVPFLRLKKPQSPFISRIIRDTVKTRDRRTRTGANLADQELIAKAEDLWDKILHDQCGLEWDDGPGLIWTYEVQEALRENHRLRGAAIQKRVQIAAKMHSIVEQEKELASQEKRQQSQSKNLATGGKHNSLLEQDKVSGDSIETTPVGDILSRTMNDNSNFKTRGEMQAIQGEHAAPRTEEQTMALKAARAKRKEEKARRKAEKLKRQAENARFWQKKANNLQDSTTPTAL